MGSSKRIAGELGGCGGLRGTSDYAGAVAPVVIAAAAMPTARVLRIFIGEGSFMRNSNGREAGLSSLNPQG
ncbi:hypothetical protein CRES_0351 [Corynebacterium resistens DSM 45100]|uniref:Uncharacterized protein n=1 Tax=Corynebacterium resistens (strain DSM 45100 / JCM 12819 / GTC 2026 / SICGH 158) TaxID=662755 RepID=F8DXG9_CORRG|nr:hypothetical protein CRES_0351 [Corynebacterium resistens DSM 45100]